MNSNETTHATNPLDGITAALENALQQAREQADTIINDAHEQAKQITDSAQADAHARDDMERTSIAIQEHAAALHTLALGLTGHNTTPCDNDGDTHGGADDDNAGGSDTDNIDSSNVNESANDANVIPPAPTVTKPTSSAHTTPHTARRADGTTRKLAPWEQPQDEPQDTPTPEPKETPTNNATTTERNDEPEHADTAGDATAPTWDAPLIIDAPLQL